MPLEGCRSLGGRIGRVESVAGPGGVAYPRSRVLGLDLRTARRNGPTVLVTRDPWTGEEFDGLEEKFYRQRRIAEARTSAADDELSSIEAEISAARERTRIAEGRARVTSVRFASPASRVNRCFPLSLEEHQCHVMNRNDVLQIRIEPALRDRVARLREERHVKVSAWLRSLIADALVCELGSVGDAPLPDWRPCRLEGGWGSALSGPAADRPAEDLAGSLIRVTDRSGNAWTATVTAVVERSSGRVVVTDSGRPR